MRTVLKYVFLTLLGALPAIATAAGQDTHGHEVSVLMAADSIGKVMGIITLGVIIFASMVTQSTMPVLLGILPATMLINAGPVLGFLLGVELPTEPADAVASEPIIRNWIASSGWYLLFGLFVILVLIALTVRASRLRVWRMHQPAVAYWKGRLLYVLAEAEGFVEDEALRLALAGVKPDTDPIIARLVLREMTQLVAQADVYDYGGPTSLRGTACIHAKLRALMRDERCGGFVKRALAPLRETLESMPRSLEDALKSVAEERSYDDLLRLKLQVDTEARI